MNDYPYGLTALGFFAALLSGALGALAFGPRDYASTWVLFALAILGLVGFLCSLLFILVAGGREAAREDRD